MYIQIEGAEERGEEEGRGGEEGRRCLRKHLRAGSAYREEAGQNGTDNRDVDGEKMRQIEIRVTLPRLFNVLGASTEPDN